MATAYIQVKGMKEVRAGMKACEADMKDLTRANKALAKVAEADIRGAVPSKSGEMEERYQGVRHADEG